MYVFALGELFAVCGVPLAVVVGVVVVVRTIYVLISRREQRRRRDRQPIG